MADCLFCKIASGELETDKVFEDDLVVAINDINPQAPIHNLILPKQHVSTINDASTDNQMLLGHMILTAKNLAREHGVDEPGYRLIMNCNREGGQTVFHIHLHLLAGRQLTHLG